MDDLIKEIRRRADQLRSIFLPVAAEYLTDAAAALEAAQKDAERYRWLTECKHVPWGAFLNSAHEVGIDAAIDAAIAAAKEQSK